VSLAGDGEPHHSDPWPQHRPQFLAAGRRVVGLEVAHTVNKVLDQVPRPLAKRVACPSRISRGRPAALRDGHHGRCRDWRGLYPNVRASGSLPGFRFSPAPPTLTGMLETLPEVFSVQFMGNRWLSVTPSGYPHQHGVEQARGRKAQAGQEQAVISLLRCRLGCAPAGRAFRHSPGRAAAGLGRLVRPRTAR
jgi:hypothetical protein